METSFVIRENGGPKELRVVKLIGYKAGGFGVMVSGHKAKAGLVFKYEKMAPRRFFAINRAASTEYTAADQVKLSYHPDGFVQFSGVTRGKIRSGRDEVTGEPKGLGLISHPFSKPVNTGPSIAIAFWGLDGYSRYKPKPQDHIFDTRMAKPLKLGAQTADAYVMEIFIAPNHIHGSIVRIEGREYAYLSLMRGGFNSPIRMTRREQVRVVRLNGQNVYLCILMSSIYLDAGSRSGYYIMSPTDPTHGLMAIYPPPPTNRIENLPSLSYSVAS